MKINLNDTIRFTVNDYGKELLCKYKFPESKNNQYEMHLWEFCKIFGCNFLHHQNVFIVDNTFEIIKSY
jgi:hypothetical protein